MSEALVKAVCGLRVADSADLQLLPTFDVFVNNVDLRWCLLLHCDYVSLAAVRQISSAFIQDVPIVLNAEEWCAVPENSAALHCAQWAVGGEGVLHKPLSQPLGRTVVHLQCPDDVSLEMALSLGAQRDETGAVMEVLHPVGAERMLTTARLAGIAPPLAPFLHDPLVSTTTVIAGPTHSRGVVRHVSTAVSLVQRSEQDAAGASTRSVRAFRSRHLVASGGDDGVSLVSCVSSVARADALSSTPLAVTRGLRHRSALSAVAVRPSGALLTACVTSTTLRVYELEAAHLAAARITAAGHGALLPAASRAGRQEGAAVAHECEWNYVEHARLEHPRAQLVVGAAWLDDETLVEVGGEVAGGEAAGAADDDDSPPQQLALRTWHVSGSPPGHDSPPCRATVTHYSEGDALDDGPAGVSALAASEGLVVVTRNPPSEEAGFADVWWVGAAVGAGARARAHASVGGGAPALTLLRRLREHTAPLYACAVGGGLIATGGDDCTVRLWAAAASSTETAATATAHASLQTLHLQGKVWALALHSHLLVAGGALGGDVDGQIRVQLYGVADLANRSGHAVALRTLQARSIASAWGVRSVATHGGMAVVAGGDDGVVHVWALAQRGKADPAAGTEGTEPKQVTAITATAPEVFVS